VERLAALVAEHERAGSRRREFGQVRGQRFRDHVAHRNRAVARPVLQRAHLRLSALGRGGDWPKRAREACRYFLLDVDPGELSLGVRLLADLRGVFAGVDRMQTKEILERLCEIEEAPWSDMRGKLLDSRRLARELGRSGVAPVPFKDPADKTVKGYSTFPVDTKSVGLADARRRYLPVVAGNEGNTGNYAGQRGYRPITISSRRARSASSCRGRADLTRLNRSASIIAV
jgi:hypothetical protein